MNVISKSLIWLDLKILKMRLFLKQYLVKWAVMILVLVALERNIKNAVDRVYNSYVVLVYGGLALMVKRESKTSFVLSNALPLDFF